MAAFVEPPVRPPVRRPLRVFAFDPMRGNGPHNVVTIEVENEAVGAGPSGGRVRVVDYDATVGTYYAPVNLDNPAVLMQGGLEPSEGDPRFHQQMVYAVSLKVLENFDRALGRRIAFGTRGLRLLPHAFRDSNAFFDPKMNAVCFGYFTADRDNPGENLPGQTVFTCLSQDIIAHEVTHAIVHRLRRHLVEPSNDDVLAFHEGFADIVAIFQHFTIPTVLDDAVAKTRGALQSSSALVELAAQFGHATGRGGALRTALDRADPKAYEETSEPHERGSILVAAVFDAFFEVYQDRISDLIRIASEGRGVLPEGELHPDLVDRLAREAQGAAQAVLTSCMRAFEYLPPVDITFGDFLRALVTADYDLTADRGAAQRRAMIEAFRRRGIYPDGVRSLAEDSLRWPEFEGGVTAMAENTEITQRLVSGAQTFQPRASRSRRESDESDDGEAPETGPNLYPGLHRWAVDNAALLHLDPGRPIQAQGFHASYRVAPDGALVVEVVAQFVQTYKTVGQARFGGLPMRGGTTVVASADGTVRFAIAKPLPSKKISEEMQREAQMRKRRQLASVCRRDQVDPALPWADAAYLKRRSQRSFRGLHRGLLG